MQQKKKQKFNSWNKNKIEAFFFLFLRFYFSINSIVNKSADVKFTNFFFSILSLLVGVFHISISWWLLTGVWLTANLLKYLGLRIFTSSGYFFFFYPNVVHHWTMLSCFSVERLMHSGFHSWFWCILFLLPKGALILRVSKK